MQIDHQEFSGLMTKLYQAFPTLGEPAKTTVDAWFAIVGDLEADAVRNAIKIITKEVEQIYPSTNVAAMIRNRAIPTIGKATITDHLMRAHALLLTPDGDPYSYLKKVSPTLLEMSQNAGFFERSSSIQDTSFRANRIAEQYTERRDNAKKGFKQPEAPAPVSRQIPAPAPRKTYTDEEVAKNRENCQKLIATLAGKNKPAVGRSPEANESIPEASQGQESGHCSDTDGW